MKIKSIKKITSKSNRYDLEVDKFHCFFANGVLVHNSSSTFAMKDGDFHVCGRKIDYKPDVENVYWKIANKYNLGEKLQGYNFSIRGEIYGEGLQKNRLGIKGQDFFVYDVVDLDTMRYFDYAELLGICGRLGLKMVPVEYVGPFTFTLEQLISLAHGKYDNTKNLKEGIVVRTSTEQYSQTLRGRSSFKVVDTEYLLKNNE